LESYDEARRHLEDAREHRGRLVQALAQLDDAYYRLRRTNASLAEAWRAADLAERAKAEFITNISHEIRTPLNLIVGFSEMMLSAPESYGDQPLPREYRGDLHAIYRSAQHLLALTDDVLDLAQAAINHLALIREPADLASVVHGAADIVREYIEIKGLQLQLHVPDDLPSVRIDSLRIRQVLLNLLTNAARFTDQGAISVTLELMGESVRVSVADTGRGLTAEQQERIFQEFHHVDPAAARDHRSTGLGLPISKKFIELHGGRMWVESTVGTGTTFRFVLPVSDQAGPASQQITHASTTARSLERALVLDRPNEGLRRLLQRGLSGYRVFAAADPEQADQLAFAVRASAIITIDDSASASRGPTPRIVCPSPIGGTVPGLLGVTRYLTKPVDRAGLRAAIDQLPTVPHCILIVDDDLHSVRLLARILKAEIRNCTLLSAHNGAEALERMRAERPDLVLLDLMMPGCSGQEVLESMASTADLADLPVIVISGHAQAENILHLPGELHLSVPEGFQLQALIDVLQALLASLPPPRAYLSTEPPAGAIGPTGAPV
jgi:signal transduction histidine kinase/CheY-like chemotaxis protein